jgi:glycine/D-amino acid oxidase-like deaminating enzyme
LNLYHSDAQRDAYARRGNAMRMHGVDAELLDTEGVRKMMPFIDLNNARFPVLGGLLQRRGGTARHDAVVWGYARAASDLGVDIIQNCEVTDFIREGERVVGVQTSRGPIRAGKTGVAVAGNTSRLANMVGLRLPIESHVLQAFVSEAIKPFIDCVVTMGAGHFYISQSDKGGLVFGGDIDGYNSYAQRGNLPTVEHGPGPDAALLGRHHGYDHGWLAHHRSHPDRRPVSQCRLVLRRIQGDARLRLVFCPSSGERTSVSRGARVSTRPLCERSPDRRERSRRSTQPALSERQHENPMSLLR